MKSKWVITILIIVFLGAYVGYKMVYKAHESTEDREVSYKGTVEEFIKKIAEDELIYSDKIIELKGVITSKSESDIVLGGNVYCQFENSTAPSSLVNGSELNLRGRYIGYDELLEEIKLDKCIILN